MINQLQEMTTALFLSVLKVSADHQGLFRLLVTSKVDGEEKPLLVVGNAHGQAEDGHVIAVLNPTEELATSRKVAAGVRYPPGSLKKIVSGQCDGMVELWIRTSKEDKVYRDERYINRSPQPARFKIR